jgi:hypothetical protein
MGHGPGPFGQNQISSLTMMN